jgi:dihydrodipicolinate synthase/N-acetylneuraminate lyase
MNEMPDRTMAGVYPILSTPFDSKGRIVHDDLRRQVNWMVECGVHGVGIAVASEVYKFTESERDEVLRAVVEQAAGRVKVVMNTGAEGTDAAIFYSKRAEELGADALMIRPTSFIPTVVEENIAYFERIANEVNIPIFMQDQGTAQVSPGMAAAAAKRHENLCYIKVETPPTVPRMAETHRLAQGTGLILFGGAGGAFVLEEFRRGSVGTMPGSTLPDVFVRVWDMWRSGDEAGAEAEFARYAPIIRTLAQGQGLAGWIYKHIMVRRGIFEPGSAYARHPALKPDDLHLKEIDAQLEQVGLLRA